ncbi:DMT family transporter [Aeromicrobium terrae]|uniref:DMT family transporter n=1 Tax=Aeromicrobium terrae TaxID=2498846 RepID=UPI001C9C9647|nr:DMT family transporter [Aeromicrobium terrae]
MNWLFAAIAVLGVSASGPLMAGTAAPALAIAFWRNAMATAVLAPYGAARGELTRPDRATVVAGLALAVHFAAWVSALKHTSVAAATALVTTQIVWVVLVDRWRGATIRRGVLLGLTIAVAGVLVVTGVDFTISKEALAGDALAVLGGLGAAVYLVAGEGVRTRTSTLAYVVACYGICAAVLLVVCLVTGVDLTGYSAKAWWLLVAVTICAQLLGHSILNHLLAVMSPTLISLLLLLEVPGAALLAGVFLDQSPAVGVYVGLGLILAGLVIVTVRRPVESAGQL